MKIGLYGIGALGHALLSGWLNAGFAPEDVCGVELDPSRAAKVREDYGIRIGSARQAAEHADAVVLAVASGTVPELLDEIGDALDRDCVVLSLAAGVDTGLLEGHLPAGIAVIRAMPNTAVAAGAGMSVLSPGADADEEHLLRAEQLLRPGGEVIRVPEALQDAATALSGSAPAYFYEIFDHMARAGAELGLPATAALTMAITAAHGAAAMIRFTGESPSRLRDASCSPGGTTSAALDVLRQASVGQGIEQAVHAAARRSAELGLELHAQHGPSRAGRPRPKPPASAPEGGR
jgi:pyrroline-5-carboxylate reductase